MAAPDREDRDERRPGPRQPFVLRRPRLESLLDETFGKRLTTIVAGAGFGKSTLLACWTHDLDAVWHTVTPNDSSVSMLGRALASSVRSRFPGLGGELAEAPDAIAASADDDEAHAETVAARLCEELSRLHHDLVLIVDDVHELDGRPGTHLLATLTRQAPETVHVVLSSRAEPPFPTARLRGQGAVAELTALELAFTEAEIEQLLVGTAGVGAAAFASELHGITGGWPAAVRMALEALRGLPHSETSRAIQRMRQPGAPVFAYLAEEVFAREPARVRQLIRLIAPLPRFSVELCVAVGAADAGETLSGLAERGLLIRVPQEPDGWLELHALVREFARTAWPLSQSELRTLHKGAAACLEERGCLREALEAARRADDQEWLAAFLLRQGDRLLTLDVKNLIAAIESLPAALRTESVDVVLAEAYSIVGDIQTSLELLERLAGDRPQLPPRIATWIGIGRWQTGAPGAVAAFRRGHVETATTGEESLLLSWWARCHLTRGELAEAGPLASRAVAAARAADDPVALALALHALAFSAHLEGRLDDAERGYLRALEVGERAQDPRARSGTHANLAALLSDQGRNRDALAHLDAAIRLGELYYPFGNLAARARASRARVLADLGRFEEALEECRSSIATLRRWRSFALAEPILVAADIHRVRGALALARAAYEEALAAAEQAGHTQLRVSAQIGIARLIAYEEPDRAIDLIARARESRHDSERVAVSLASGWVAAAAEDTPVAVLFAAEAERESRASRKQADLAEALELRAAVAKDPQLREDHLREAIAVWDELERPLDETRCELALARFAGNHAASERWDRRLRAAGVRVEGAAGAACLLACLPPLAPPAVAIRTLGGFQVLRNGRPVPLAEWQSKKARDLLKLLVSRRGRPTPRDALMEVLWPGEATTRVSPRFSVALSVVRSVLDPEHIREVDAYVSADNQAVSLRRDAVALDIEAFLQTAATALEQTGAVATLQDAEALYGGDFLEEDAYEDWAAPLREEARAAYVSVTRRLAEHETAAGRPDSGSRYLRRLLERDPFDERAHLDLCSTLAAAGQHGEARRAYGRYATRMAEIGVEAARFPAPSTA